MTMTKFADQLYDDLMCEHGAALAQLTPRAARKRYLTPRRTVLATGGVGLAAAGVIAGTLVTAGGAAPAYAATTNPDGTVSLAVYQDSGYAQANKWLRGTGDNRVVVVPVRAGCPSPGSLRKPRVPVKGRMVSVQRTQSADGAVTVSAQGIPAGDILVVGMETTAHGGLAFGTLTSPPAPKCLSLPAPPPAPGGPGSTGHRSGGSGFGGPGSSRYGFGGAGSGKSVSSGSGSGRSLSG
jgi:hypothetical protein